MERFEGKWGRGALTAVALILAVNAPALAIGPVSDELRQSLQGRSANALVPVIISFADRVDPHRLQGMPPRARNVAMIQALREQADKSQGEVLTLLRVWGASRVRQLWLNNSLAAQVPAGLILSLEKLPGIKSIRSDALVPAPSTVTGTTVAAEWNINAIGAPDLWSLGYRGAGSVVANMDTGVDASHPDLAAVWRGGTNSWYDPNGEHASPYDANGHGTQTMGIMVGGTAGGTHIGVAPEANWIAVKIFNDAGFAALSGVHLGFQWLLDPDGNPSTLDAPQVVNNSWSLQNSGNCNLEFNTDIQVLKAAGISVVFAGGNSGPLGLSNESPANNPDGFGVGAVDSASNVAGFSSRGPSACDGTFFPELTAPGVNVTSADLSFGGLPLYAVVSGTSFASPHVAGALALLAQAFPNARVTDLEVALKDNAQDSGSVGPDDDYGYGVVDVLAAFNALTANPPPPVNNPPLAINDSYGTRAGTLLLVNAPGVLGNDTDPEGDPLTAVVVNPPVGGSLTLNPDGSFSYMPAAETTTDSFTYQASDGTSVSNPATVSIDVAPNQPPVAADDTANTGRDTPVLINVAANDHDPEGALDPASVTLINKPNRKGSVTVHRDGTVTYSPRFRFAGTERFSYTVKDKLGATSNQATVTVTVTR